MSGGPPNCIMGEELWDFGKLSYYRWLLGVVGGRFSGVSAVVLGLLGVNLAYGYHIGDIARFLGSLFSELFNPKAVSISVGLSCFFLFSQSVFFAIACFATLL